MAYTEFAASLAADVEEQNRRLEEELRRKYAENYVAGQHDDNR